MAEAKCCCNCSHCARWRTSKGIQCHCDIDDRYLGYCEVMDTDRKCKDWEKETKCETQLIDRQEVIRHIEECLDKNGYVNVTKFAKCMRRILNMPYIVVRDVKGGDVNEA